jgi:hypothetical protein
LALLTKNILSAGSLDDNLSTDRRNANLNTGIAILGKLTSEKLWLRENIRLVISILL